jgi:Uma2 family endonuclease
MAAIATERQRYTVAEFIALADELELAGSQEWVEIIGGELVSHASAEDPHMRAAIVCLGYLIDAQRAGYGRAGTERMVVLDYRGPDIPVEHAYKPDAFFVLREREAILQHPEVPSVVGAPDVVVEVLSPTTARFDRPPRGKKFQAYERAGVRHYWLVDTRAMTITTFALQAGKLVETAVLGRGDTLRCPLFPELGLPVTELFGSVQQSAGNVDQ